jgi:adiponectin receptor
VNGAATPPFTFASADAEEDTDALPFWHALCPCRSHLSFSTLPHYLRDNEHVVRGYRANLSLRDALRSVVQLHNESINIWSHGLAFLGFVALTLKFLSNHGAEYELRHRLHSASHALEAALDSQLPPSAARWPLYVFLLGACTCLLASAVCHTFACVSARVNRVIWRFDYAGAHSRVP